MWQKLNEYEAADQIDDLTVDFGIGVGYGEMQIEAIKERHDRYSYLFNMS